MARNNWLCRIDSLLASVYKEPMGTLKEIQNDMSLDIDAHGKNYLLYSFDKIVRDREGEKVIDLQPFFNSNEGVKSMCDYFLFCWEKGRLFVLLIELKQGKEQVTRQLKAGYLFASYLVNSLNRVENMNITPIIRKISIRDYNIVRKGTSMKSVVYDSNSFCTFEGTSFHLPVFLK